jgi:hypothetical protein
VARVHGPRRDERHATRPVEQALRDLEGRVALADHDHALVLVVARVAGLGVVGHALEAGDRRLPGRRDADREDGGAAAILAVGGGEHDAVVVLAPRRLPPAAVADLHAGALGEEREAFLHLGPGRHRPRPVHGGRHQPAQLRLVGDEAVVVIPLVLAGVPAVRRVGFRPRQQALEDRPLPEHAAGTVVGGDDGMLDPVARQEIRRLQTAGPAADHDHVVVPRREGPLGLGAHPDSSVVVPRNRRDIASSIRSVICG